jgi:hypothetical protein
MTFLKLAPAAAFVVVAACAGNPLGTGGGGDPVDQGDVPPEIRENLSAISYNPDTDTLLVTLDNPGASPLQAPFVRTPGLDVPGYDAYTYQESGLLRSHLALVAENARGNLFAAAVSDGGQFNYRFGGGSYARVDTFRRPASGAFSYSGSYAGVFVPGTGSNPALPDELESGTPFRVTGDILMTGSFTSDIVEGGVTNRVVLDDSGAGVLALTPITLKNTEIDGNGRFLGDVEFAGSPGQSIGEYGGLFGGIDATDVAGALVINPVEGEDGIWEFGVFNIARCGTAGAGAFCP